MLQHDSPIGVELYPTVEPIEQRRADLVFETC
jgi:hypothetical protein